MADPTMREVLAELTALRAEVEAQRQARRRWRASRRLLPILLVALLVALTPLALLAANPFTDLNSGSVHNANIDAIYNAGITTGCDPGVAYCPNATVTREEMASFLARTAGLGGNPPVANAKTALTATSAANASTVEGYAPSGLVRVARTTTVANLALSFADQTYGTPLTIQAPASGFVLVTGVIVFKGDASCPCTVAVLIRHFQSQQGTLDSGPSVAANAFTDAAFSYVFPVAAGTNTFEVHPRMDTGPIGAVQSYNVQLTGIFVPFGSTGGSTLAAP